MHDRRPTCAAAQLRVVRLYYLALVGIVTDNIWVVKPKSGKIQIV